MYIYIYNCVLLLLLCVCVFVCVYGGMRLCGGWWWGTHACLYISIYRHTYIHTNLCNLCMCIHAILLTDMYMYVRACVHACIGSRTPPHTHTHIFRYINMRVCVRERDRESVCVCVCVCEFILKSISVDIDQVNGSFHEMKFSVFFLILLLHFYFLSILIFVFQTGRFTWQPCNCCGKKVLKTS